MYSRTYALTHALTSPLHDLLTKMADFAARGRPLLPSLVCSLTRLPAWSISAGSFNIFLGPIYLPAASSVHPLPPPCLLNPSCEYSGDGPCGTTTSFTRVFSHSPAVLELTNRGTQSISEPCLVTHQALHPLHPSRYCDRSFIRI